VEKKTAGNMFERLREEIVNTPELRAQYERTRRRTILIRQILMSIDAERERTDLTKADLARRIGVAPSTVRRLFSSGARNPTLQTMLDLLAALDLELAVQPARRQEPEDGQGDVAPETGRHPKKGAAA